MLSLIKITDFICRGLQNTQGHCTINELKTRKVKIRQCKCDYREKAVLNRWVLSRVLKSVSESKVPEIVSRGTESSEPHGCEGSRGNRQVEGGGGSKSAGEEVVAWRMSDRYGLRSVWILIFMPVTLLQNRSDRRGSTDNTGS